MWLPISVTNKPLGQDQFKQQENFGKNQGLKLKMRRGKLSATLQCIFVTYPRWQFCIWIKKSRTLSAKLALQNSDSRITHLPLKTEIMMTYHILPNTSLPEYKPSRIYAHQRKLARAFRRGYKEVNAKMSQSDFVQILVMIWYYFSGKWHFENTVFEKTAFETYKPMDLYSELYGISPG